jgi:hypothetical protein
MLLTHQIHGARITTPVMTGRARRKEKFRRIDEGDKPDE